LVLKKVVSIALIALLLVAPSNAWAEADKIILNKVDIIPEYNWETIIEAKWDGIRKLGNFFQVEVGEYNTRYGLMDGHGKTIFKPEFNKIILVDKDHALAQRNKNGNQIEMVGMDGKVAFTLPAGAIVNAYYDGQAVVTVPAAFGIGKGGKMESKSPQAGVIDNKGKFVIPMTYYSIFAITDAKRGVLYTASKRVGQETLSGLIDRTGKIVLPFQYQSLNVSWPPFNRVEQLPVLDEKLIIAEKKGKFGAISLSGKTVIPFDYDEIVPKEYRDEKYNFGKEYFRDDVSVARKGVKYGIINRNGKVVLPFQYDEITPLDDEVWSEDIDGRHMDLYETGLYRIRIGSKYGMANKNGQLLAKAEWSGIINFKAGLAQVVSGNKKALINKAGKVITPDAYNYSANPDEKLKFPEERLTIITQAGKYGFITETGIVITKPQWDDVKPFRNGYARVKKNGKWGFVDRTGNVVLTPQWDEVSNFEQGWAIIRNGDREDYIDPTGQVVLSLDTIVEDYETNYPLFGEKVWRLSPFNEFGYALMSRWSNVYVIDRTGRIHEKIANLGGSLASFNNGLAKIEARDDVKVTVDALIDTQGNLIFIYPDGFFDAEYYSVTFGNEYLTWDKNHRFPDNYTAPIKIKGKMGVTALKK